MTFPISIGFVAYGTWMALNGHSTGWGCALFFGFCAVVSVFESRLIRREPSYAMSFDADHLVLGTDRGTETLQWDEFEQVFLVTTTDGPWVPDVWLLFNDRAGTRLAIPTEADGFDELFDVLGERFPGFDFEPFVAFGTNAALYPCWSFPPD